MKDYAEPMKKVMAALIATQGRLPQAEAATMIGLSPRRFRGVFRKTQGESFRSACVRVKLEPAQKLLRQTRQSIAAISEKVGYSRREKLDRSFKRVFAVTPAQYRKNIAEI